MMAPLVMKWWNNQSIYPKTPLGSRFAPLLCLVAITSSSTSLCFAAAPGAASFRETIQPILTKYCYDCHADGMNKGKVAFDEFTSHEQMISKRDLWWAALKNVRAGVMPPEKKPRPTPEDLELFATWVKREVFG